MKLPRLLAGLLFLLVATWAGSAAQGPAPQPGAGAPPLPPPRGTLTVNPELLATIKTAVKPPAGFEMTLFAGPPVANYPACVTATNDGVVFVCVDRNGSLQTDQGMGFITRLVDRDGNGQADEYSVFAAVDSPRGAVFDGDTLYVSHPPFVTAFRDTNADGVSDERRTLVRGLGFGLDFRGADHTTNQIELGIDGWLYVAVGDYGAVKAVGADGQEIQMRGGGNVRVRPDGTDLEIYARGTRNDYDIAIDPYLNIFARGNTNDGGGFDIRLYHFVAGATYGYPTLFRNFGDEVVPPLADYGTGSGTGMLYVAEASLPAPFGDALYSVDWGRNAIFRHPLKPRGATFAAEQEPFLTVPRPNDMTVDANGRLYVASWAGGQFRYAGENVGYLVRLTHPNTKAPAPVNLATATDVQLVEAIGSSSLVRSREAQATLRRRGRTVEREALLERRAASGALQGRVAAIFTLKQLSGVEANATLVRLAADPAVRPFALRALADRPAEIPGDAAALFVRSLADANPRVKLEAISGLRRMGAVSAATSLVPLTADSDVVIANVAINALVALSAIDAPLAAVNGPSDAVAAGALRVLQQIHQPATVSGLIAALPAAKSSVRRSGILQALARLHYRDGVWRGTLAEWWGTRPDTTGPYYDPAAWVESPRIRGVLTSALLQTADGPTALADFTRLATDLERNRVVPPGGADLLRALAAGRHQEFNSVVRVLVGRVRLDVDAPTSQLLDRLARTGTEYRTPVVKMVVAAGPPTAAAATVLRAAAIDATLAADVRASAFTALASVTGPDALRQSIETFAVLAVPSLAPPLETAWTQFVTAAAHATNVPLFVEATRSTETPRQRLGYAVLVNLAADPPAPLAGAAGQGGGRGAGGQGAATAGAGRGVVAPPAGAPAAGAAPAGRAGGGGGGGGRGRGGVPEAVVQAARTEARQVIDAGWNAPSSASLVWAAGRMNAVRYQDQIAALSNSTVPAVREAVVYANGRLAAAAPAAAPSAAPAGPVVSSVPYDQLVARLAAVTGDAAAGRRVFEQQACAACHTTAPAETEKGPYLGAGIFTRYSRAEVLESILRPAAKVAQGFATNSFTLSDGRQLTGFVIREGQDDVVMRDLTGTETTLRKAQITARSVSEGSIMPTGLVDGLTLQQLASLVAFLEGTNAK